MTLRGLLKQTASSTLALTGADAAIGRLAGSRYHPLVLGYHRVVDDYPSWAARTIPSMLISRAMLARHLDWLAGHYRCISLDELGARIEAGDPFTEPVAAVTFDDGYRDVYDHAFPLLKARGIPAAVFVAAGFVATGAPLNHDRLYPLVSRALAERHALERIASVAGLPFDGGGRAPLPDPGTLTNRLLSRLGGMPARRFAAELAASLGTTDDPDPMPQPLSWAMLAEMAESGVTIGAHTVTHPVLTAETDRTVLDEISRSRALLEQGLGLPIRHFAYPDGRFNRAVVRFVAQAGCRFAYTTCRHRDPWLPQLTIPRLLLWERSCVDALGRFSPSVMRVQINGVFDLTGRCAVDHSAERLQPAAPAALQVN
jgi:peptidoglycan/xylan/chitin deacetylase (PgdA/CDA1 family)